MWVVLAAAATGILSGMAVGGGSILVPILVYLFGVPQHQAQGVTLVSFVPVAAVAVFTHWRSRNIIWGISLGILLGSLAGALAGASLAAITKAAILRRVFGIYLAAMGLYAFFQRGNAGGQAGCGDVPAAGNDAERQADRQVLTPPGRGRVRSDR